MTKRRVLITGSTGGVGTILTQRLHDDYDLVGHAREPDPGADPVVRGADLVDYDAVLAAMDGIDTVVHLAGAASPEASWGQVLLELGYRPRDSWSHEAPADEPVVEGGRAVDDSWPKGS